MKFGRQAASDGWTYGLIYDDGAITTPRLVPYWDLERARNSMKGILLFIP